MSMKCYSKKQKKTPFPSPYTSSAFSCCGLLSAVVIHTRHFSPINPLEASFMFNSLFLPGLAMCRVQMRFAAHV